MNAVPVHRFVVAIAVLGSLVVCPQPAKATVAQPRAAPLVFFRTLNAETTRRLRRVVRVDPRTGRQLPPIVPPADLRSFIDAVQVGDTSFVVWASKRGDLWLGAARQSGQITRRWQVGRASGFEVRPIPLDPSVETGTGFVHVTADGRYALLVNGQGGRRIGRYVDLRSARVRYRPLPEGIDRDVADATALGHRFVLVGYSGAVVTLGPDGEVLARGQVKFPAQGPKRVGFVNIIPLPGDHAVLSFITGSMYRNGTRRSIARYNARAGTLRVSRSYPDFDGYEFAATQTRFAVFGNGHWTIGRIDGGPLKQLKPLGPGPPPPAAVGIDPETEGAPTIFGSAASFDGRASVVRIVSYTTPDQSGSYGLYEVLDIDIPDAHVLRRTRFGDETGGRSTLPYAFDIRVS